MASFVLSFFPLDVLDEIWDLMESVSEGFFTYSCNYGHAALAEQSGRVCNICINLLVLLC